MPPLKHNISCAHLSWLFELCNKHSISLGKVIKGLPYPQTHLTNKARFITWQSFADLVSNIARYADDAALRDTGRKTWQHRPLLAQGGVGRLLFSVRDQYFASFGGTGFCSQHYPIHTSVQQLSASQLSIKLGMQPGHRPCIPFFTLLAGQMEALPAALGRKPAIVTVTLHQNGATYLVELAIENAVLSWFRRLARWLSASRLITREFARITASREQTDQDNQAMLEALDQSRARLARIEDHYQFIGGQISDVIWLLDEARQVRHVSPSVQSALGYAGEDCEATPFLDYFPSPAVSAIDKLFDELTAGDAGAVTQALETEMLARDGTPVWFALKLSRQLAGQSPIICVATNISRSKQVEQALSEHTSNQLTVIDSATDAIITYDAEHKITRANPASFDLFGYQPHELPGRDIKTLMPLGEARLQKLYQSAGNHSATGVKVRGLRKDHSILPLEVSFTSHQLGGDSYQTCIIRDLSNITAIEQQLQASQKMSALGQLSGEIAHDFNNLLVAIRGYTDLALQAASSDTLLNHLEEIKQAGEMGTAMTRKLLSFSRRKAMEPRLIEANALILGVRGMITRLLPANIVVGIDLPTENSRLMADPTQLEQVLLNLAVNARDAMPDGGTLTIKLTDRPERLPPQHSDQRREDYILIEVSDTGSGMDEEAQGKIFEPLYTTKPEGKGTGLGLAVVSGVVEQHEGFIEVKSGPDEGTRFSIYLPKKKPPQTVVRHAASAPDASGTETILLVEDNNKVREIARLILVGTGYQVIEAGNGREAVEKFKAAGDSIALVLMDVVMPDMGGQEAATQMYQHRPDVKIVFTSGYLANSTHTQFVQAGGMELIAKPYGTEALRAGVRAILDGEMLDEEAMG